MKDLDFYVIGKVARTLARVSQDGTTTVTDGVTAEDIVRCIAQQQRQDPTATLMICDDGPREIARMDGGGMVTIADGVTAEEIVSVVYKLWRRDEAIGEVKL